MTRSADDGRSEGAPTTLEVLQALPAAIVVTERDGTIVRWLSSAEQLFGYTKEEAIGQSLSLLHRPDVRERMTGVIVETLLATGAFSSEVPCVRKDGTDLLVETDVRAVADAAGDPRWLIAIVRDVTDRKRLLEQRDELGRTSRLAQVAASLSAALTPQEVGAAVVREGIDSLRARAASVSVVNERTRRLELVEAVGYPPDAVERFRSVSIDADFPPAHVLRTLEPLFLSTAEDRLRVFPGLASLVDSNGRGAMVSMPLVVDGQPLGALGFNFLAPRVFDAAERAFMLTLARLCGQALRRAELFAAHEEARKAAVAARERVVRLQGITASLSRALTRDEVGRIVLEATRTHVGAAAAVLFTLEGAELRLVARAGAAFEPRWSRIPIDARLPLVDAVTTGAIAWSADGEVLTKAYPVLGGLRDADGRPFAAGGAVPIIFEGQPVGAIGLVCRSALSLSPDDRDFLLAVAQHCGQALERARLYQEARDALRAKDEFLAVLGHELRNPLAPIVTALEVMKMRQPDALTHERGIVERQVHHLSRLVDDLLDISRITRGGVELDRQSIDLAGVIGRAVETSSPILEQRRHRLTVSAPPGVIVDGDATRLAQSVANLLTNAAKYTPPGGDIGVAVRREGGAALLEVRDNGPGISAELMPNLFEPFTQGQQQKDRALGGLGLGLAIVRRFVELHQGTVEVTSSDGAGSTFTIRLPLLASVAASSPAAGTHVPRRRRSSIARRILVVDDNEDAAGMLAEFLSSFGHEVRTAGDGPASLVTVRDFVPEIAFLDIGLPGMDGYELAAELHALPALADTTLVALTGYGQPDDVQRARDAGFSAHFTKPVPLQKVLALVEEP